jgi:hypothetical protein
LRSALSSLSAALPKRFSMSGFAVSSRSSSDAKHVAWSGIIRMRWRLREQPESTTSRMIAAMTAAGSMRSSVTSTITSPLQSCEANVRRARQGRTVAHAQPAR